MFVTEIREMLHPGSGQEQEKNAKVLQTRYDLLTRKALKNLPEWEKIQKPAPVIQGAAWKLFLEYVKSVVSRALVLKKKNAFAEEDVRRLVNSFLDVLYPNENYAEEIISRLNYLVGRVLDAVRKKNADPYSPLDNLQSFQQMLSGHLWLNDEKKRALAARYSAVADVRSVQERLLQAEFEESRHVGSPQMFQVWESRYNRLFNCLVRISAANAASGENARSPWTIRAGLKDHVPLFRPNSSSESVNPTWREIRALTVAIGKKQTEQNKKHSSRKLKD